MKGAGELFFSQIIRFFFLSFDLFMSKMITDEDFPRIRSMKTVSYFISFFDFFIHYILVVEMGIFKEISQFVSNHSSTSPPSIPLCQLPIHQYIPTNLSQCTFYILYLSFLTLLFSIEAIRRSSLLHYRIYIILKFLIVLVSLLFCIINTSANLHYSFIRTPILLEQINLYNSSALINIETCLIYTREKLAQYILIICNIFVFFFSIQCSKILPFLEHSSSTLIKL